MALSQKIYKASSGYTGLSLSLAKTELNWVYFALQLSACTINVSVIEPIRVKAKADKIICLTSRKFQWQENCVNEKQWFLFTFKVAKPLWYSNQLAYNKMHIATFFNRMHITKFLQKDAYNKVLAIRCMEKDQ